MQGGVRTGQQCGVQVTIMQLYGCGGGVVRSRNSSLLTRTLPASSRAYLMCLNQCVGSVAFPRYRVIFRFDLQWGVSIHLHFRVMRLKSRFPRRGPWEYREEDNRVVSGKCPGSFRYIFLLSAGWKPALAWKYPSCDKWHGCAVTRCDGCSALAACDGQSWRLAPWHSRGRERGSVAHVVAARLLDPRVHVVGVSQPTLLQVNSLR